VITRRKLTGLSAAAAISALVFSATPAGATENDGSASTLEALQSFTDAATEPQFQTLDSVAEVPTDVTATAAIDATVEGTNIVVPVEARAPLTLTRGDVTVGITLPYSDVAGDAQKLVDGVVYHDNGNGSVTVPVVREEGLVQIATVIEASSAPTEYAYEFSVEGGASLFVEDGTALVRSASGDLVTIVTPASAKDANGVDVPTRYVVNGARLTQVVEHSDTYDYPIVAAPAASQMLFTSANVDTWNGQPRVNLMPGWWTYAIAAPLMDLEGWNEAVGQWGATVRNALTSKTTMRQQFSCHAYGSWFAGEWNLEKARPTRTVDWTYGVAIHRCNWDTATQY